MKAFFLSLSFLLSTLFWSAPTLARGGDGVFPLDLETGRWETYNSDYTVRFDKIEGDESHLKIYIYGHDKARPLAWGKVSQKAGKTRESILLIRMIDNHGVYWQGVLYRGGLGLNLYLSDGCKEITLELIDRNIPPHY
jgi:hypothetical protein